MTKLLNTPVVGIKVKLRFTIISGKLDRSKCMGSSTCDDYNKQAAPLRGQNGYDVKLIMLRGENLNICKFYVHDMLLFGEFSPRSENQATDLKLAEKSSSTSSSSQSFRQSISSLGVAKDVAGFHSVIRMCSSYHLH